MISKKSVETGAKIALLNAACAVSLLAVAGPAAAQDAATEDEIIVTGFRGALTSSTNAKREATAFTDSVFAEDIGQFPDLNIAESLNRIPGVTIAREVNGEGLNIAIRGLNTNFTKTVLNGNQIAVASSGSADSQNVNRELDLDIFPTELFTRLDVNKTPQAHQLEGGAAGLVNMRSARPFDYAESQVTYSLQGSYGELTEEWSPRGALIASGRWETGIGEFGALIGYSAVRNKSTTNGYETIGVTNANLTYLQCGTTPPTGTAGTAVDPTCVGNTSGGNGFNWSNTVAAGVPGATAGATLDAATLLALNPGMTIEQIGSALIPRLGRPAYFDGQRDRDSLLVALQYAPNNDMEFYLDIMGSTANREFNRLDLMFEVRASNFITPTNMEVDENNVLTAGTFYNSRAFLEARPYDEEVEFINVNPGAHFDFGDNIQVDVQGNVSRSVFFREQPTVGLALTGATVDFTNTGGDRPTFDWSVDVNDPNAGWSYVRLNVQNEKRVTATRGFHTDVLWGDDTNNIRFGAAWDQIERTITALDNTGQWENFACRNGTTLTSGAARPACAGGPGSAVEVGELGNYLLPGPAGFVTPDYDAFFAATNYQQFFSTAPFANGAATGANSGGVDESTIGLYVEANSETEFLDRLVRFNVGTRWITTDQTITGPQRDGAGNLLGFQSLDATYDEYLPSFNSVLELTDNINLRMAASRSLTRQNPNAMLPNTTFSDPGAQNANQGNPNLTPFLSTNFDFGGEWYTGAEGYFGVMFFNKSLSGFTQTGTNTVPFSQLGIDFDSLSDVQRTAINNRGGPNVATVTVSQQVNAGGVLDIRGYELTWVQPLDFVLEGLGFTANYTRINQSGSGAGAPVNAVGVPRYTYNVVAYYENYGFSGRLSYNYSDYSDQTSRGGPADAFPLASNPQPGYRFNGEYGQLDAAFRYDLAALPSAPQLTLDLININGATRRETQGYENLVYKFYDPGYSVLVGIRGTF